MGEDRRPMHFVCTWDEAAQLIDKQEHFWVCNCGCREGKGGCRRSRTDVCLTFDFGATVTGSGRRQISRDEADAILDEARTTYLVARPFRDDATRTVTEGLCFCCSDCCGYFLNPEEVCDKGKFIEKTDVDGCTVCGDCEDVCHFKARLIIDDEMLIESDNCYGCGLCEAVCPTACIELVPRCD